MDTTNSHEKTRYTVTLCEVSKTGHMSTITCFISTYSKEQAVALSKELIIHEITTHWKSKHLNLENLLESFDDYKETHGIKYLFSNELQILTFDYGLGESEPNYCIFDRSHLCEIIKNMSDDRFIVREDVIYTQDRGWPYQITYVNLL